MRGNIVYVAIAAIFGIIAGYARSNISLLFIALYAIFLFAQKRRLFLFSMITICLFYMYFVYIDHHNKTKLPSSMTLFTIRFVAPIAVDGDQLKSIVQVKKEKLQLIYYIKSAQEKQMLSSLLTPGAVCTVKGTLERPALPRNPNAFHYRRYLRFRHIHWILKPQSISLQDCHNTSPTLYEWLLSLREKGLHTIETHFPAETVGIVQALLYGERGQLDESLLEGYQKLGLIHLLAISGLHVTLLVGAVFSILIRFTTKEMATIMLLIFLPIYIVLTGASPSVIRASFTAMIFLIVDYRKSTLSPLDSLSMTLIVMLLLDPYILWDVGFQLSFIVTFALILSSPMIMSHDSIFCRLFFTAFIAQLSALPFLLYYFFEVSLWSIPLNIIFVPFYSFVILPLSFMSVGAYYVHPFLSVPFIWLLQKVIVISSDVVAFFSSNHSLSLVLGRPSFFFLICYAVAIFVAFVQMEKGRYFSAGWVAFVIVLHAWSPYIDRYGEVVLLDVGQGDCIYIELPYRKGVYLIDTGGTLSQQRQPWQERKRKWDVGKDVVVPFLKSNGVRSIDKLIATHEDLDHIGAAEEIIHQLTVKQLVIGKRETKTPIQEKLVQLAKRKNIDVLKISRGNRWIEGGISFYVLHPWKTYRDDNNHSIVLYTKLGGLSWLFTGDLEETGEKELIRAFPHLEADVLKVAHHGSDTSTTELFLEKVQPKIALISVGEHNRYHHPSPDVIERLQKRNVIILRTDQHGAIRYTYSKNHGTFSVMMP
jgi:competence protein ComEC